MQNRRSWSRPNPWNVPWRMQTAIAGSATVDSDFRVCACVFGEGGREGRAGERGGGQEQSSSVATFRSRTRQDPKRPCLHRACKTYRPYAHMLLPSQQHKRKSPDSLCSSISPAYDYIGGWVSLQSGAGKKCPLPRHCHTVTPRGRLRHAVHHHHKLALSGGAHALRMPRWHAAGSTRARRRLGSARYAQGVHQRTVRKFYIRFFFDPTYKFTVRVLSAAYY